MQRLSPAIPDQGLTHMWTTSYSWLQDASRTSSENRLLDAGKARAQVCPGRINKTKKGANRGIKAEKPAFRFAQTALHCHRALSAYWRTGHHGLREIF